MERARRTVRMCVFLTVLAAIVVGIIYYMQCVRSAELTEGVLISIMSEIQEGQGKNVSE